MGAKLSKTRPLRPNIFEYHDLLIFLKDWFDYLGQADRKFSLRKLSQSAGIDHSYISRMLRGHVTASERVLDSFIFSIGLKGEEVSFLRNLRDLSESQNQDERVKAFKKILKNKKFRQHNETSVVNHQYLSTWYYPAIRELTRLSDFKLDTKWIRKKLNNKVTVSEAKEAIQFLEDNELIQIKDGRVTHKNKQLTCVGGIFRLALSEYHSQLLEKARNSIYDVDRTHRQIMSHTLAMPKHKMDEIREVLERTVSDIIDIDMKDEERDSVYQISLLAFPLTDVGGEK